MLDFLFYASLPLAWLVVEFYIRLCERILIGKPMIRKRTSHCPPPVALGRFGPGD